MIPDGLKVINLGLPKSGTTTLAAALTQAGLRVADWKVRPGQGKVRGFVGRLLYAGYFETGDPLQFLDGFDALTEIDVIRDGKNLWPQTDWALLSAIRARHPGAKFILSVRDPASHADSMRRWSNLGRRRLPAADVPGLPAEFGKKPGELERWIEGHISFCRHVFAGADDFLEYHIEDPQARDKIGAFLGLDLPWWGKANENARHPTKSGATEPAPEAVGAEPATGTSTR
ncbi:MAG: sulfotransferase family protein [Rhodobacterales bacterium CG2_30_65_12]|nr:MAG: sulfotransferase family protein [Rhodobacterales bacterium CG2_30_65_12]